MQENVENVYHFYSKGAFINYIDKVVGRIGGHQVSLNFRKVIYVGW